jgi:hypothetical protein
MVQWIRRTYRPRPGRPGSMGDGKPGARHPARRLLSGRSRQWAVAFAAVVWLGMNVPGCISTTVETASPGSSTDDIGLDRLPEGVLDAARDRVPGLHVDGARAIRAEGGLTYEIRGRAQDGRRHKVRVSASGQVLAVE